MRIDELMKTKYQLVLEAIEHVHHEHRYDAGAMMGTLTDQEAERDYRQILRALPDIPGLSEEERENLKAAIETRIAGIPQVEAEKSAEYEAYEASKKAAFEAAKVRFNALSAFEQMKIRRAKQAPDQIDIDWVSPAELNGMYVKKR